MEWATVQRAAGERVYADIKGAQGLLGLLRQLEPRGAVILGCAMLTMAVLAAAVAENHNGALAFGAPGALLIGVGGLASLARRGAHAAPNPATTIAALCWLALYGIALVVILTEPGILHRAFGAEAFRLPIEYVVPAALLLLLLPLWPGFMGLASMLRQAMHKGRGGVLGILLEARSALASDNPAERRMAIKALWFFAYFILLLGAWIAYAEMIGV
jgi:hypothetical protein